MASGEDPRQILRRFGLRPKKSLGQNFLVDSRALNRIVSAADLTQEDRVLEIGPGVGALTHWLLEQAAEVVAVELDADLVRVLTELYGGHPRLRLIAGDILKLNPPDLFAAPYKVVANVPYYITSAILRHLLEAAVRPSMMILTVQREVAQRIVSKDRLSLLAISIRYYGRPAIVARIPAGSFYPPPKVDSAVIRIDVYPQPVVQVSSSEGFFRIVRAGFSAPRKQLHNSLTNGLCLPSGVIIEALEHSGIDPRRRAETLSLDEWGRLTQHLETYVSRQ